MKEWLKKITCKKYITLRNLIGNQRIIDKAIENFKGGSKNSKDPWENFNWLYENAWRDLWCASILNTGKKSQSISGYVCIHLALTQQELDAVAKELSIPSFDKQKFLDSFNEELEEE